jgi:hypothetical protein
MRRCCPFSPAFTSARTATHRDVKRGAPFYIVGGIHRTRGPPEQLKEITTKVTDIYAMVVKPANIKPD